MGSTINLTVKSDFDSAAADLKKFGTVSETERKKIEKFVDSFKSEQIDKFEDRTRRATAAVKATRGPVESLATETRRYRSEIEKLIRKGIDPQSDEITRLTSRYKQLEREIEDVNKAQKQSKKSFNFTEAAVVGVGVAAADLGRRGVDAIIEFTEASLEAASAAEEIEGKFDVVFSDIGDDARDAAATIAGDFDLAMSTVNELLGDTGDILTGIGFDQDIALDLSKQVGTLALDLASFTNFAGGAEGASAALTKALLGEAESAKALGIVIRQDTKEYKDLVAGLQETENITLVQAKALAALQIATEQSQNAIGDYARTAESTANIQRTLDEQLKRSKEAWGAYLNEGITPVRKAFRDFLKETNDIKAENEALNNAYDGQIDNIDLVISGQKKSIQTQKEAIKTASTLQGFDVDGAQRAIELSEQRLETLERLRSSRERSLGLAKSEREAELEASKLQEKRDEARLEAADLIEKRRVSSLSSEEKQIEAIQEQINKWVQFRDVADVQSLLNDLISERNQLLEEQKNKVSEVFTLEEMVAANRLNQGERDLEAVRDREKRRAEIEKEASADRAEREEEETEQTKEELQKRKEFFSSFAFSLVDGFTNLFGAIDQLRQASLQVELADIDRRMHAELAAAGLLEETERERINKELQEAFAAGDTALIKEKQDALQRLSIVEKFEKEKSKAEYKASLASWRLQLASAIASGAAAVAKTLASIPFPFNIPLGILQGAASAVQVGAVAQAKPQPPAFAEGGSFRTSGPQTITVGDNIGGVEDVEIKPVSSSGLNVGGGGNKTMRVIVDFGGGRTLTGFIQEDIDDNLLRGVDGGAIGATG